jgi:tetratricopeptide (TPR) repeat protein
MFRAQLTQPLMQQTLPVDRSSVDNLRAAADAGRQALSLVRQSPGSATSPALDSDLDDTQRADITAACYTLYLMLADLVAQTREEGQSPNERPREALAILARAANLGPPSQAYYLRRARYLEQLGDRAQAAKERERAENLPPRNALDYFLIGYEAFLQGNRTHARKLFDQVLSLDPNHFWATYYLALCHLQARNWEAAKALLTTCLSRQSAFVWPYVLRGIVHAQLDEFEAALVDFEKAQARGPDADAAYCLEVNRGLMHLREGALAEAGSNLKRANALNAEAASDFERAIALKPVQYHAYVNLAHVRQLQKRFDDALAQLDRAIRLPLPVAVLAECHAERARNFYLAGKFDAALKACDAALHVRSEYAVVFGFRGFALLALKRYEEAGRAFDAYLSQGGPPSADIYRGRGFTEVKKGHFLKAREDYSRALALEPNANLYTHRGWTYASEEAWKPALGDFEKALAKNPRSSEALIGRGLARVMLGSYAEGVSDAETAMPLTPDTAEMLHNIACIYAQALERARKNPAPRQRQGLVWMYRQRAEHALRAALAQLPQEERKSFWKEKMSPDKALDPIRDTPEFRRLDKEFGGPAPGIDRGRG